MLFGDKEGPNSATAGARLQDGLKDHGATTPNPRPCATDSCTPAARIIRGQRKREIRIPETWPWANQLAAALTTALTLPMPA